MQIPFYKYVQRKTCRNSCISNPRMNDDYKNTNLSKIVNDDELSEMHIKNYVDFPENLKFFKNE